MTDPATIAQTDRVRRGFTADASRLNSRWRGDITYIRSWEQLLFLATVIGIASRRVVGYAMADHLLIRPSVRSSSSRNATPPVAVA